MSSVPGAVVGWFTYLGNPLNEIDLEFLTRDPRKAHFTLHHIRTGVDHATPGMPFDPSAAFHEYRFDWYVDRVEYYVDGKQYATLTNKVPDRPSRILLNHWSSKPAAPDGSFTKCTYNSGVYLRTGYQVNFGRREAGEFVGVVVHRVDPKAIRGNVLWLDTGDEKFPNLRKKEDWNHVQISFKGPRLQVTLNGTKICDVTDNPASPAEAAWKESGPISFQWPHAGEAGGFAGFVKLRNVRIRDL